MTAGAGHDRDTLRVVRAGALSTLQDAGRPGFAHIGVPRSGALDPAAHHLANRLVANPETATVVETTMDGVALAFEADRMVAVTGALASVRLHPTSGGERSGGERSGGEQWVAVGWALPVYVRSGQTLDVGPARRGVRSYVAVAGGLQVPLVLGSASTDLLSGLGPKPLAAGDVLRVGPVSGPVTPLDMAPYAVPSDHVELVVHLGPRHDRISAAGLDTLRTGTWSVSPDSNRIALRLRGPAVERSRFDELASEGLVAGAVQVLPDGQLIIFLADHPTTGGYPVAAVVDPSSMGRCAQARPGSTLGLRDATAVTVGRDAAHGPRG